MKKYLAILSVIIISCDVEEGPFITDSNSYVNPDKKVLIEDFTGHKCPNCPGAARELDAIHNIYGDQIIGIAIHVGSFAEPNPIGNSFDYDFRTNWGDVLDNSFGNISEALPRGMVNRVGYPDNHKLGKGEWATTVANELKKEIDFKIHISSDENSIYITSEVQKNLNSNYNLVVCLTESNIINWQKDNDNPLGDVEDYEHNHVLRTALIDQALSGSTNYVAGEEIENTINYDLVALEQSNRDYSVSLGGNDIPGNWDAANMSIIAYIYNTNTKEIVQVEEAHLNN